MLESLNRFFPRMRLRRKIQLVQNMDIFCHLFLVVSLPIGLLYDFIVVLPKYHSTEGFVYALLVVLILFLYVNAMANLMAIMMVDVAVDHDRIKTFNVSEECVNWRYCKICNALAPPRSWHCVRCGTCILTRDHHCFFTGCCIGHQNYRYFTCFVVYSFLLSCVLMFYNIRHMFFLNFDNFGKSFSLLAISFEKILHNGFFSLNLILQIFTTGVLLLHCRFVLKGELSGELKEKDKYNYDAGIYYNLRGIFGQHMHIAWLFPLIASQLPGDGYNWKLTTKDKSTETIATFRPRHIA